MKHDQRKSFLNGFEMRLIEVIYLTFMRLLWQMNSGTAIFKLAAINFLSLTAGYSYIYDLFFYSKHMFASLFADL
uniref:Uncharacterized protein n=1 Tax=Rhizophora mucronata TaxID=61149 RepID=A0A2P2P308_RHIMU